MKKEKYPSGKCDYCGKVFERPHKFRTEEESFHIKGCRLLGIENAIKNNEELGYIEDLIDEVKGISHISSFGAKKGNRYWKRMDKCKEIIKKLEEKK